MKDFQNKSCIPAKELLTLNNTCGNILMDKDNMAYFYLN